MSPMHPFFHKGIVFQFCGVHVIANVNQRP
jgi:hypothetical protein